MLKFWSREFHTKNHHRCFWLSIELSSSGSLDRISPDEMQWYKVRVNTKWLIVYTSNDEPGK